MELSIVIHPPDIEKRYYGLKLNKYLYFQKQASKKGFDTLKEGIRSKYFGQSNMEPCVIFKRKTLFWCMLMTEP